nr:MAG TPA: Major capsid protein [Caudoviricetes sp.]
MAVYPIATGNPDYSGTFIPEVWSGKLIENFYDATVLAAISNTDYEGEIRKYGDTVNIRTTPEIEIKEYKKGQTLELSKPEAPKIQLLINQGEYFACVEDDVDKIQSDIAMMDMWTKDASERMKIRVDSKVLGSIAGDVAAINRGATAGRISGNINLGTATAAVAITKENVLDFIVDLGTVLDEANAPEDNRYLVIPAKMAGMIKKSDLQDASLTGDSTSVLRNGRLGMIDRFTLYMSHNLPNTGGKFSIYAGHKMGLTFASQMTNMESLRAETTFGNIVRGLQVYGFKVVKPEALALGVVTLS